LLRAFTISLALSTSTCLGDFLKKTKPMKSAPASAVAIASSTLVIPQILTKVLLFETSVTTFLS